MSNELLYVDFFYETEEEKKLIFDFVEKNKQIIIYEIDKKKYYNVFTNKSIIIKEKYLKKINVFTKSFITQKNNKKLFPLLDKKLNNFKTNSFLFEKFKKKIKSRTLNNHYKISEKIVLLLKNIKFNLYFENFENFKKIYLIFDEKEVAKFNENYKKIEKNFNYDENQKRISKKFINEILFEIIKFIDL
jgi:hypothetical protein